MESTHFRASKDLVQASIIVWRGSRTKVCRRDYIAVRYFLAPGMLRRWMFLWPFEGVRPCNEQFLD